TPAPIDCDHGASAGGEAGGEEAEAGSALPGFAPSARLPVSAAPSPRNARRPSGLRTPASLDTTGMLRQRPGRTFPSFAACRSQRVAASLVVSPAVSAFTAAI